MKRNCFLLSLVTLFLIPLGCAGPTVETDVPQSSAIPAGSYPRTATTTIDGWWELGDSAGPFSAELRGDDILAVERDLSHGDYGSTQDRFVFARGRLVSYAQDSSLRLMDPGDPSRLVPVSMSLQFADSGALVAGSKRVDGAMTAIEEEDIQRVLAQVDRLLEQVRAFARVHAGGGEPVQFLCPDGQAFAVTFAGEAAILDLGQCCGQHILTQQVSASGAKYGNEVFTFWNKGKEAMVERFGERYLNGCIASD